MNESNGLLRNGPCVYNTEILYKPLYMYISTVVLVFCHQGEMTYIKEKLLFNKLHVYCTILCEKVFSDLYLKSFSLSRG